jgi:hypothetical protein
MRIPEISESPQLLIESSEGCHQKSHQLFESRLLQSGEGGPPKAYIRILSLPGLPQRHESRRLLHQGKGVAFLAFPGSNESRHLLQSDEGCPSKV